MLHSRASCPSVSPFATKIGIAVSLRSMPALSLSINSSELSARSRDPRQLSSHPDRSIHHLIDIKSIMGPDPENVPGTWLGLVGQTAHEVCLMVQVPNFQDRPGYLSNKNGKRDSDAVRSKATPGSGAPQFTAAQSANSRDVLRSTPQFPPNLSALTTSIQMTPPLPRPDHR